MIRKNKERLEAPVSSTYGCECEVFLDCFCQLSGRSVNHVVSSLRSGHNHLAYFTFRPNRYGSRTARAYCNNLYCERL